MNLVAPVKKITLPIEGMTCSSCANRIERKLNKLEGVTASVNYATETASVSFDDSLVAPQQLVETVEAAGYRTTLSSAPPEEHTQSDPTRQLRDRLIISAVLSLPVLLVSMIPELQFEYWQWFALQLATPVVVWGAWPFHKAAWLNLRHRAATMDTLVSIGTLAAWAWSVVALFFFEAGMPGMKMTFDFTLGESDGTHHLYLEVAAVVTTFILAGRYFEARAKSRSGAALKALMQMGAKDVAVLQHDGTETHKPIDQLRVGDRFVVRPGEKVATDGVVEEGSSAINMSMLTGESAPVSVAPGSEVVGATGNVSGRVVVRATKVGNDTALAQIAQLVTNAQSGKAPVQRLADRVSAVFVPVVLALSVATLTFWLLRGAESTFAFSAAVAVLIIACPCALGLATPTALLVGTGRGAQLGLLIKGLEVLESSRRIDTIVLDKTGTVTTGEMTLLDVHVAADVRREEVLSIVGSVENASEHPIGRAIARAAEVENALRPVASFRNHEGVGVEGVVDGITVFVGRPDLLASRGMDMPTSLFRVMNDVQNTGKTTIASGWDGKVRALFVVGDSVKTTSAEAVRSMRDLGLEPLLLTGDNELTALAVAREVGIRDVIAGVLPKDKADVIKGMQLKGAKVAMVGDGVNDAPALAQADLGLSIGTGTDVAIEASDITLVSGDLRAAPDAIRLSQRTFATIKGNLFWAFAYNIAALPLAAAGLLNPLVAGAAMVLSSVFVVTNSLRLRSFKPVR